MIRFSKEGITFDYNNDEITWLWWWIRRHGGKLVSLVYAAAFSSFKEYWIHVGSVEKPMPVAKIRGFEIKDLISTWVWRKFRNGHFVILWDLNLDAKPATFWRSIPDRDKKILSSEVVVLACKGYDEMRMLCDSIDENFALALGTCDGHVVYSNDSSPL